MKQVFLTDDSDTPLLLFLWRWKVATTAILSKKFYPTRTPKKAYYRLLDLQKGGFIQCRSDPRGPRYVWLLNKRGFNTISDLLPELREKGFAPEHIGHDLLVTAFHIGDALLSSNGLICFTEQQLRRYPFEQYPSWVPPTDLHRPDGYWRAPIGDDGQTIALEVELNEKGPSEYRAVCQFYDYYSMISRVIWLTRNPAMGAKIHSQLKTENPDSKKHSFVSFTDYLNNGWTCKVHCGENIGASVSELLGYRRGKEGVYIPPLYLLSASKSPSKPDSSRFYRPGDFSN